MHPRRISEALTILAPLSNNPPSSRQTFEIERRHDVHHRGCEHGDPERDVYQSPNPHPALHPFERGYLSLDLALPSQQAFDLTQARAFGSF